MFVNNIDPVLFRIAGFEIRYYGVIFALGFLIAYFMLVYLARQREIENLDKDGISDLLIYEIIGIVIGARFFEVFIYNPSYYFAKPTEIIALWHGGLSFHGGLIGAVIAGIIFCRIKKVDFFELADIMVIPAALALALGRIANFINGELYGEITDLPWAVKFRNVEGFRHPSQIYESLKNLFIFSVLWVIKDKDLPNGFLFWSFIAMYGLLRFLIEFVKEQPIIMFNLTMGQLFSLPMFVVGITMLWKIRR